MSRCFFFAGGGTGGHLYPAIAVAERIARLEPAARIHFLCSQRPIDSQILSKAGFQFTALPAQGFSARPRPFFGFITSFWRSCKIARERIASSDNPVVVGVGGFAAAPAAWAAHRLKVPLGLINVDIVPGKANRFIAGWAEAIFVQFEDTRRAFARYQDRVHVVGCPLRTDFDSPQPDRARQQLGLDPSLRVLLITGASSGAQNINQAICELLPKLDTFTDTWQIVHLAGTRNLDQVNQRYAQARIPHKVVGYYDQMADLYAAADLVIGRSGAVSVAEYAASGVPSLCMPYPYHRDRQQYLNASKLVEVGAAVIVDDVQDLTDRVEWLWEELEDLMRDDAKRREMSVACRRIVRPDAALQIARGLLRLGSPCP
jgi:UDP-N-acetylglucosamine--N-acetylmuramyl-(pentapeptide) pyrophosphoryl-undecaprenol N-acetylglucosamine transferase